MVRGRLDAAARYHGRVFELQESNAAEYLEGRGMGRPVAVRSLGGGVSNTVLLIETHEGSFVLKQALGKLRVEQDWFSDRTRVFRESGALRRLRPYLPAGAVPEVLFEDPDNCLFAMTAAPLGAPTWKTQLLAGTIETRTAEQVGRMLGLMFRASWRNPEWEETFGDQTVFDQLRLDPYYRSTAGRHTDLQGDAERLLEASNQRRFCLVHGDWSPKNFLVAQDRVMAIDFEVIHFGDPAFDAAFLLNHLLLKSFYRPEWAGRFRELAETFWETLRGTMPPAEWFERATLDHLGWLLLARIDGKSPAEYICDPALKQRIRGFAREMISRGPSTLGEVFQ
jgi:5-methylthioribose kinase